MMIRYWNLGLKIYRGDLPSCERLRKLVLHLETSFRYNNGQVDVYPALAGGLCRGGSNMYMVVVEERQEPFHLVRKTKYLTIQYIAANH